MWSRDNPQGTKRATNTRRSRRRVLQRIHLSQRVDDQDLDADPNRVQRPLIKEDGVFREATWDEAFALIDERLGTIRQRYGNDAVGIYVGNPNAHSLSGAFYLPDVLRSFRTKNLFSASTVDQMPKQVSGGLMFGTALSIPVPDVDHTDYLLMLGANPYESNGSLFTAPDLPGRLEALRARGGRLSASTCT